MTGLNFLQVPDEGALISGIKTPISDISSPRSDTISDTILGVTISGYGNSVSDIGYNIGYYIGGLSGF